MSYKSKTPSYLQLQSSFSHRRHASAQFLSTVIPTQLSLPPIMVKSPKTSSNKIDSIIFSPKSRGQSLLETYSKTPTKNLLELPTKDSNKMPRTPTSRTVKFETMTQSPLSPQERKEESEDRLKKMRKYIRQMEELKQISLNHKKDSEENEKIFKLSEETFSVLNIQVKEIDEPVGDSLLTIFPFEQKDQLSNFYYMLVQEISEFPYTFLSKIKVLLFTICGEVSLLNPASHKHLNQKLNNGLFIVNQLKARENIRQHLYRIICYHFLKVEPQNYRNWRELFGSGSSKGDLDDIALTLICIMKQSKALKAILTNADKKIKFLKNALIEFEPSFFDEEWWNLKQREKQY